MPYTLQVLRLPPKFYSQLEIVHAKTSISKPRDSWGVSVRSISDLGEFHLHSKKVQHPAGLGRTAPYRSAVPALVRLTLLFVGRLHLLLRKKKKKAQVKTENETEQTKKPSKIHINVPICVKKLKSILGFFFHLIHSSLKWNLINSKQITLISHYVNFFPVSVSGNFLH